MAAITRFATMPRSLSTSIPKVTSIFSISSRQTIRRQQLSTVSSSDSPSQNSSSQASTSPSFEPLTYHVHRTPGQQLPIYHLAKSGGNRHLTRIRKISGSVEDLKNDLRQALSLGDKEISINSVNGHIVIKGWKKFEVAKFLEEKRF